MTSLASASSVNSRAFDLLAEPIRRWMWREEWTALREIQEQAIPLLIESDNDVIIAAPTAGGKTEAAFLPLISRVHSTEPGGGFDLVYIGPLRALINDQFRRLQDLCENVKLPVHPWHGDISQSVKARARKNPCGILLITPESLEALFVLRGAEVPRLFQCTQAIVIDELHALLDSERGVHLRSLLTRIELSVGRRIRRVGLSATLGDMTMTNVYLRPEAPEEVAQVVSHSSGQELRAQLRAYTTRRSTDRPSAELAGPDVSDMRSESAMRAVGRHIFEKFRGQNNLLFAASRGNVEQFSDLLRRMCEQRHLPNEFFPHHASLSREHRGFVERHLKDGSLPVTAICTSTLELGIDIGEVACVGQVGPPWSVAALRQRLGRSGRRAGMPAVLRMYAIEPLTDGDSHPVDTFHLGLVRSVAMVELLIKGWCEPPNKGALHFSTLTHQILSVIAERGGATATRLYATLCEHGPFRSVNQLLFGRLLRRMGDLDAGLIEQAPDGTLLLGPQGERIVEHYSFYAVFQSPQEYRVVHNAKTLGTIPVVVPLVPDLTIIFCGRRWRVLEAHDREKVIEVAPDRSGKPPIFGGDPGEVHQTVIQEMRDVLLADTVPAYLDQTAAELLSSSRAAYRRSGLQEVPIQDLGDNRHLVAPWVGTVGISSLAIVLSSLGYRVGTFDGILEVSSPKSEPKNFVAEIERIAGGQIDLQDLVKGRSGALVFEKFHQYLSDDLLLVDALSHRLDLNAVPRIAQDLCPSQ